MLKQFEQTALHFPDRIAYQIGTQCITYGELREDMHHYGSLLKKQGKAPVVLYGHKETDMVKGIMACLYAGRTYVPVEPSLPKERVQQILKQSGTNLVLTKEALDCEGADVLSLRDLEKFAACEEHVFPADNAYMIFTSGSTGMPKGVPVSRANLQNFIHWISSLEPLNSYQHSTVLNQASFSFDLSVADFYYALWNGHTLLALEQNLRADYNQAFAEMKQADVMVMTPSFMKLCLLSSEFSRENFPKLKCVYFCGETLEIRTVEKLWKVFPDLQIINAYGPTEATSAVCAVLIEKAMLEENELPAGKLNTAAAEITIENEEIVLRGASVAQGYLADVQGGFFEENGVRGYRTGDYGWIRDGYLYCKGRMDTQIKYMGYRIELMDIERNIIALPEVEDAAVTARKTPEGSVRGIDAYVIARISSEEVRELLHQRLPDYMCPRTIRIVEELPLSRNGKKDRGAL